MLSKTKPLLLGVQPFDVDRSRRSWDDGALQFFHSLLGVGERCELNEGGSSESIILANELDIEYLSELLEELPNIVFFPTGWEVAHIHDELDLLGGQLLLGRNRRLRPPPALAFLSSFLLVILDVFWVFGVLAVLAVSGLSSLF